MSLRWYIYYCALCGGCAAYVSWAFGLMCKFDTDSSTKEQAVKGMILGLLIALSLSLLDTLWNGRRGSAGALAYPVLVAVAVGCLGGAIGGALGQELLKHMGKIAIPFGWMLTGLLIGGSLGVYDLLASALREEDLRGGLRKTFNGLVGGGIGGLLGGLLFLLIGGLLSLLLSSAKVWSPTAWGFVALGICIGLMIGLSQVILKEAWVRVEAGFRSGRELILTRPEITIGRGESCDIGLFGDAQVEKLHCRIVREGNKFVLMEEETSSGTFVNEERVEGTQRLRSGDVIRLGRALLRFGERQKRA